MRSTDKTRLIQDVLTVIEKIFSYPENEFSCYTKNQSCARYLREIAGFELQNEDLESAKKYIFCALKYNPFSYLTFVLLMKYYLKPYKIYNILRTTKKKFVDR